MHYKLSYLLSNYSDRYVTISQAAEITGLSLAETEKQLNKLTELLAVTPKKKAGRWFIPKVSADTWAYLSVGNKLAAPNYTEDERRALIYLLSFSEFEELSVFHFQDFLAVSKGTILADIKKLRQQLSRCDLRFDYSRKTGFVIAGPEEVIRQEAQNFAARLLQTTNGKIGLFNWLDQQELTFYAQVRDAIVAATKASNLVIVPSRIDEITFFLGFAYLRVTTHPVTKNPQQALLESLTAYEVTQRLAKTLFSQTLNAAEKAYWTSVLMTVYQGEIQDIKLDFLLSCSSEVIHRMENLAAIQFTNFKELLMNLFYHLVPAYFRISNGFYLPNVLIDSIRSEYREIFEFTKEALLPLEKLVQRKLPEEEIGFFTILFGGEISSQKMAQKAAEVKALIVCPNGISSSLILQSELKKMFPTITFNEANSVDQIQSISEDSYDVIFSTVGLESKKPLYVVKPLMSPLEKNRLINRVQEELLIPGFSLPSANEIVDALLPYVQLKEGVTQEKLYKVLNKKMNRSIERKEDNRPMLTELLTPDMIQLTDEKMNWEDAIRFAAKPMLDKKIIEPRYAEAMIDKVKQFGPFIHIGKGIALPHARPEDGVNQIGMSLLKVKEPVLLMDDEKHPIQIFVCLAAVDNEAHLRALASLTRVLSNSQKLDQLLNAETKEEILTILTEGENEE